MPAGGPRTSTFCNPLRHNAMQNNLVRGPTFLRGPRTIDFYNNLYFNKIQIGLVRGLLSKGTNPIPVTIDEIAVLSP